MSQYTAFETADVITDYEGVINAGYTAVGVYGRADRCPFEMAQGLIKAGVKLWTVAERGHPTDPSYFTTDQAKADFENLYGWMQMQGQPKGGYAGPAIDYDADPAHVEPYLIVFHDLLKSEGYLHMPYGSGAVLAHAIKEGYAHEGWLAQAMAWGGSGAYNQFAPRAAIVQAYTPDASPLGMSGDFNTVKNPAVLWS